MTYRVIVQPRALADVDDAYMYLAETYSPQAAMAWYVGCMSAIESLSGQPQRCQIARESATIGAEVRQLIYRRYRSVHRILFAIRDDAVRILCVRHAARDDVTAEDLGVSGD